MTREDAAYLAGLLDGEGCIQARASQHGWVRPNVEVCMTNSAPLRWARAVTGVGYIYAQKERRQNRRQPWKWIISNPRDAASVLRQVVPFMKVKRAESMAFIMLSSIRAVTPRGHRRVMPEAEYAACRIIALAKSAGGL